MKTKYKKSDSRLKSRPEQLGTERRMSEQEARQRVALIEARRTNRGLRTDTVLTELQNQLPEQYELAEIVGRWIWLEFPKDRHRAAANTLLDGVLVKDVADPYAAEAWADYVAIVREVLK